MEKMHAAGRSIQAYMDVFTAFFGINTPPPARFHQLREIYQCVDVADVFN